MDDCTESRGGEEIARQCIDPETGEILQIQISGPESQAAPENPRGNFPQRKGQKTLYTRVQFLKLKPLGAHVMAAAKLTGRQYQVFFLLLRDANYGGRCYTHPDHLGKELGMDPSDVRKALKALEKHRLAFRSILPNKGHCYTLNPAYVTVGSDEEEAAAQAAWNIERIRRMKEQDQKARPARA